MAQLYARLASTVSRMLATKGQPVGLVRVGAATYDPATGVATQSASATLTIPGAVLDFEAGSIDGTRIQRGDKRVLAKPTAPPPRPGDAVVIAGVKHTIIDVRIVSPAGTDVLHELQVRA